MYSPLGARLDILGSWRFENHCLGSAMWCSAGSPVALVNHHADTVPARQKTRTRPISRSQGDGQDLHLTLRPGNPPQFT